MQYLTEKSLTATTPPAGCCAGHSHYMGGDKSRISPIMTNSESISQFGNNAYGKPATALKICETIMGRELFDYVMSTPSLGSLSSTHRLRISSAPWKMLLVWIWIGFGAVGSIPPTTWDRT